METAAWGEHLLEVSWDARWLLIAIVLVSEFGLKQWFEGLPNHRFGVSKIGYVSYRAVQIALLVALLTLFFNVTARALLLVVILGIIGTIELPIAMIQTRLVDKIGFRLRWLQLMPMFALAIFSLGITSSNVSESFERYTWKRIRYIL